MTRLPRRRLAPLPLAAALLAATLAPAAPAASVSWACLADSWETQGCWNPAGVPGPNDDVNIPAVQAIDRTVQWLKDKNG